MTWPSSPAHAATTRTSTGSGARCACSRTPATGGIWSASSSASSSPPGGRRPGEGSVVGVAGFEPAAPCSQSRCATGLRHTPTDTHYISPAEEPACGAHRPPAVVDARLLLEGQLGERAAARRVKEHGIVAEAVGAPRRLGDAALDQALDDLGAPVGIGERDHAAEARGAPRGRHAGERPEQERAAARVVEARAPVARRLDAGGAAERAPLEPRVVGEGPGPRRPRPAAR